MHFVKAHREWRANLHLTAGQHFTIANAVDSTSVQNHQSETVDALANIATATTADRATVATLTDTTAQLLSELASAQAKLISLLLDNQRLLKRLSNKGGSWNTSRGVTVVDARTIPWSGSTTPGILSVCHTPGSVPASNFIREPFEQALIV